MKIIYLANIRLPTEKAHGFQIMKMCEAFVQEGAEVELILPHRKNPLRQIDPFDYYQLKTRFVIKRLKSLDPRFLIGLGHGIYIKFQIFFFLISLFFYLFFRGPRRDEIFYTRDEHLLPLLQRFSKQVVWESHALPKRKKAYAKFFARCSRIIVLTAAIKKTLLDLGIPERKILIAPDAVDLGIFDLELSPQEARAKLSLFQDKIILGFTGNFRTKGMDKGLRVIFQALKILKTSNPNLILLAVGGSPEDIERYQKLAREEGVGEQVQLLGRVGQSELAIYQKAFDMLLMPFPKNEHFAYYMSPLKLFEYMAAQRPIVASNLPSLKEILNDGNAVLVKPDDPESLVQGIEKILSDKELASRISEQAFADVQNYTWQNRARKILAAIK